MIILPIVKTPTVGEKLLHRVGIVRQAADVRRFHIMRTNRLQTVGAHSYGVAMLVNLIEPKASSTLLMAALTHDLHERSTGDIPSTAKWLHPKLAEAVDAAEIKWNGQHGFNFELTKQEEAIIKFCDYLELFFWAFEDVLLGNVYAIEPLQNIVRVLDVFPSPNDLSRSLYNAAKEKAEEYLKKPKQGIEFGGNVE